MILLSMILPEIFLAGTEKQIASYNANFSRVLSSQSHVVIVGGGRITSQLLREADTIIAVEHEGTRTVNPEPNLIIPKGGTLAAEEKFLKEFEPDLAPETMRRKWRSKV
jgi:hypothetical protein